MVKAKRKIIKIDEDKCTGCGECIPACKEGALKIVDGKARLVSEVYCDGLGACLGQCPYGALTIEEREADEFDEVATEAHLKDQKSTDRRAVGEGPAQEPLPCGCPGTMTRSLEPKETGVRPDARQSSELRQWPIQLTLIPVSAPYLKRADLVLLADCSAVAYANLHQDFLRGRVIAMACPKLDDTGPYVEKLTEMIRINDFRSIQVVMMEVPCCEGLGGLVDRAIELAGINPPLKKTIISLEGEISSG